MKYELIDRAEIEGDPVKLHRKKAGIWFHLNFNGKKYSLVDFEAMFKTSPVDDFDMVKLQGYRYEAMLLNSDDSLNSDVAYRGWTVEDIINSIEDYE